MTKAWLLGWLRNKNALPIAPGIRFNALNQKVFFTDAESATLRPNSQKAVVKRLCRSRETLLSRPGRGAALRSADRYYPWRMTFRGQALQVRQRSGFRDVHASKGSNRA